MAVGHQSFTKTGNIFKALYLDFVLVDASRIKQKGKEEKRIEFIHDVTQWPSSASPNPASARYFDLQFSMFPASRAISSTY